MDHEACILLKGNTLFRKNELVFVNKSDELKEYCDVMHRHDFIEIAYVIQGKGMHIVGDSEFETSKGDLFIINYDVPHMFAKKAGEEELIVYNCAFMPGFLDEILFSSHYFQDITSSFLFKSLFVDRDDSRPDLRLKGTGFYEVGDLFAKMYNEYKTMNKGYVDIIRAYLIELIIKAFRYMDNASSGFQTNRNRELMERAVSYLRDNYNSDIRLDDMAMKAFLSKNYFSRLFKETTGINFCDYLQKIRIEEACNLLSATEANVMDISFQVGFKDIKSFYNIFKRLTGKTPGEYRKSVNT